ncbi:heterokaryon incompatibility protein-domain-containing protein [Xylariaceae sp. FL1272]|nr:heterokaryon incompatibility protein-domain-containing protein [Xylariaceae sp. FL1272]
MMRLLNAKSLLLEEFTEDRLPPYAILSHTWTQDELLFEHVRQGSCSRIPTHSGYKKVASACCQAVRDHLKYVWVDTCCIDKSSSAELSEAINSMFRWYAQATVCYAFLADVQDTKNPAQFSKSRWFTRGWTLQELLAPRKVHFYSSEWTLLGTKESLCAQISEATQIDQSYLRHRPLSSASIAQRMSWASRRVTTRQEDMAYSMLGIFDVNMPLIYGEGSRAFQRLQDEILKTSNDESIFAWWRTASPRGSRSSRYCGLLAEAPADFSSSADMVAWPKQGHVLETTSTTISLESCVSIPRNHGPAVHQGQFARLQCRNAKHLSHQMYFPIVFIPEMAAFARTGTTKPLYIPIAGKRESLWQWLLHKCCAPSPLPNLPILKRTLLIPKPETSNPQFDITVQFPILPDAGITLVDVTCKGAKWDPYWKAFTRDPSSDAIDAWMVFKAHEGFNFSVHLVFRDAHKKAGRPFSTGGLKLERLHIASIAPYDLSDTDPSGHIRELYTKMSSYGKHGSNTPRASVRVRNVKATVLIQKGSGSLGHSQHVVEVLTGPALGLRSPLMGITCIFVLYCILYLCRPSRYNDNDGRLVDNRSLYEDHMLRHLFAECQHSWDGESYRI